MLFVPVASLATIAANLAGSAAMRMAAPAPRNIVRAMANVTAGERHSPPTDEAILLDVLATDGNWYRLITPLHVHFGSHQWELPKGFSWNGADIPRCLHWVVAFVGVTPYDPRLALATAFHDAVCREANAGRVPRVIGDAMFVSLLMPISFNGRELRGIGALRAAMMYCGVRAYSCWRFVFACGGANGRA